MDSRRNPDSSSAVVGCTSLASRGALIVCVGGKNKPEILAVLLSCCCLLSRTPIELQREGRLFFFFSLGHRGVTRVLEISGSAWDLTVQKGLSNYLCVCKTLNWMRNAPATPKLTNLQRKKRH